MTNTKITISKKLFLKTHGEIRIVQDKLKSRQFMPSKPALYKILKRV